MEPYEYTAQVVGMVEKAAFPGPSPGGLIGYPPAPETLDAPLVTQLTVIIRNLEAELARAKANADADNAASFEIIDRLRREVVLWQDQVAALDNQLQVAKKSIQDWIQTCGEVQQQRDTMRKEADDLGNKLQFARDRAAENAIEADALIDLVTEVAAYVREGWESDDQANRVKAALAEHEKRYGRRGE